MVGQTLAHYKILEKLGAGGMGEVYVAEDSRLRRRIALKVVAPDFASDPGRIKRLQREAEVIAALNHPNIVVIHSVEEADGVHFLTMELVEGKPLSRLIVRGGMALDRFFDIAVPLVDAVAAAHEKGIVHRDLKPDNIVVSDRGVVKVLDFGLAALRGEISAAGSDTTDTETLTLEGMIAGTAPYMSPEQVRGTPVDHQSDIFSLGIIFHEMATGRRLYVGESSAEILSAILREDPPPVSSFRDDLPFHLDRIIRHCLVKETAHRYRSTEDLRDDLAALKKEVESGPVRSGELGTDRLPTEDRTAAGT